MATKRAKAVNIPAEESPLTPLEEREEFDLLRFMDEFGDHVTTVKIERLTPKGEWNFVDVVGTEGLTIETLRDNYGGNATYHLQFKDSSGRFIKRAKVRIGARKVDEQGNPIITTEKPGVPAAPGGFDMMAFLQQQLAAQQTQFNTLLAAIAGRNGPDPGQMLTAVVTAFSVLRGNAPERATGDGIGQIKDVLGLIREISPGILPDAPDRAEDNIYSLIRDVGGKVVEIARPAIERAAGLGSGVNVSAAPQARPAALPAATNVNTTTPQQPEGEMLQLQKWIAAGLGYLKTKAQAGKDVNIYIDYILDNPDEPQWQAILYALRQGVSFDQVLQFDVDIAQNPVLTNWFRTLYDELLKSIREDGGGAVNASGGGNVDSGGPGGNNGNVAKDAGNGAPGRGESAST